MPRFLTLLFLLITSQMAQAQCSGPSLLDSMSAETRASIAARAEARPYPRGIFWQLTRGGDRLTLVGTVHIHHPRLETLRQSLRPLLADADLLLTEITPAEETEMLRNLSEDRSIAFITEGPTLVDQLPADKWATITEALRVRSIPGIMGAQMQPWYLMMTLSLPPCAIGAIARGDRGLDHMLMTDAADIGIPNMPLEDWQSALDVFRQGTPEEHLEMLDMFLSMDDLSTPATKALFDLYLAGEVAQIWEMQLALTDFLPMDPTEAREMLAALEDALLIRRNRAWLPVIAEAAAQHDHVFVAVGAAHLPGENGLLNLLARNGWTPVQLSSP